MSSPNGKPAAGDAPHAPLAFWARGRVTLMASPGTSWHYRTEPSFPNSEATPVGYEILGTASEAGVARSRASEARQALATASAANRARVTI